MNQQLLKSLKVAIVRINGHKIARAPNTATESANLKRVRFIRKYSKTCATQTEKILSKNKSKKYCLFAQTVYFHVM